jgi:hypothetical protein
MTNTVVYTHEVDHVRSTFVEAVYYDRNRKVLTVDLNNDIYEYSNVPEDVAFGFEDASSAGNYYRENIKPTYGPAKHIGRWPNVSYEQVDDETVEVQAPSTEAVGTPKGLYYSLDAETVAASTAPITNNYYGLSAEATVSNIAPVENTQRKHTVFFVSGGVERSYESTFADLDEALVEFSKIADALAIDATPVRVVTHLV